MHVEVPRRNDARRDGLQRPPVEGVRLGAGNRLAVEQDRSVRPDRDRHARHAAHGLEIRQFRAHRESLAPRLGSLPRTGSGGRGRLSPIRARLEQHPVAGLRVLAEQRQCGIAPGPVRPARINMDARGRAEPQRTQHEHDGEADVAAARRRRLQGEYRPPGGHGFSPPGAVSRRASSTASAASTSGVMSWAPAATARAGSSTAP